MKNLRSDYSIVIPTILPERERYLGELLTQISQLCPFVPIAVSPHVHNTQPKIDLVRALELGASFGRDWMIYMEDDAYLAPVFPGEVSRILEEAGHGGFRMATFYSNADRTVKAMCEGERFCAIVPRYFWATVCVAVRCCDIPQIIVHAPLWYSAHPQHWHASDLLLADFCASQGGKILCCVPSPVQHRDPPSTLNHVTRTRRYSRTFKAKYGEAPP